MWNYERRLQYPVNITKPNAKIAQIIISQYGGPDGEAAASFRYLSQRYAMPYRKVAGLLTDIGTEELAHLEMVGAIVRQLTKGLSAEQLEEAGFAPYYVDHTAGIWPQAAGGIPFNACEFQSKGDAITDLFEDMAAEQKARVTYDNILRLVKDPEVCDPIRFLRQREIVHFQRFGEGLRMVQEEQKARVTYDNILRLVKDPEVCDPIRFLRQREIVHFQRFGEGLRMVQEELDSNNFYMCNPEFDPGCGK